MEIKDQSSIEPLAKAIQISNIYASSFYFYLKDLYKDLTTRKEEIDEGKMSHITFENFLDLPLIVTEKIYNTLNKYKMDHLQENDFVDGLFTLYSGSITNKIKLVFDIFDVQKQDRILKEDVILILSHLSSFKVCDLNLLNEINDNFWGNNNTLDFNSFTETLEHKNSDIFILFLSFLYSARPFNDESLKFYHLNKSYTGVNNSILCHENIATNQTLINDLQSKDDFNFFDNLKYSSRNLILFLINNLHFNLKLSTRKGSSNKKIQFIYQDDFEKKNYSYNSNYESSKDKEFDEDLTNNKLSTSPLASNKFIIDSLPDEAFNNLDINTDEDNLNTDEKEKLNLSNVNHNRNYMDHSFSYSEQNNSSLSMQHDDFHYEMIVYKIKTSSNRKIKTYKIISIGNDIHYLKLNKSNLDILKYRGFHHLSGCCLDSVNAELVRFEGENFLPLKIFSSCGGKIIYDLFYFKSIDDLKTFVEKIKHRLGIRNILNYFDLYDDIGKGQFGKVRLAKNKKTGETVAVKIIKKQYMKTKEVQMIKWEIDIMRFLININNPFVIKTYDIFESRTNIYLVMEYLEGRDLNSFLIDQGTILMEKKAKHIILQICRGVKFLHQYGIIHRDLKPDNIMLVNKSLPPQIKIMDFGLSKVVTKYDKTEEGYGSLCYLAPEVLLRQPYSHKVDIWSIGIIIYYLISGCLPFDDSNDQIIVIAKKILNTSIDLIFNYKSKFFSNSTKKIISRCLERNVDKRVSSYQITDCEWFWN